MGILGGPKLTREHIYIYIYMPLDTIYICMATDRAAAYIFGSRSGETLKGRVKKGQHFRAQNRAPKFALLCERSFQKRIGTAERRVFFGKRRAKLHYKNRGFREPISSPSLQTGQIATRPLT